MSDSENSFNESSSSFSSSSCRQQQSEAAKDESVQTHRKLNVHSKMSLARQASLLIDLDQSRLIIGKKIYKKQTDRNETVRKNESLATSILQDISVNLGEPALAITQQSL